jgi:hypothetical protein
MSGETEAVVIQDKPATVEKAEHLGDISPKKRSKRSMRMNLLATLPETLPVLLAVLDKAVVQGLAVQKINVVLDGRETAILVLPGRVWKQDGSYVALEELP